MREGLEWESGEERDRARENETREAREFFVRIDVEGSWQHVNI